MPNARLAAVIVNGVGMVPLAAGMTVGGSFWTVLAGILVWGVGGGLTFPAMFVGLALLVAIANAGLNLHPGATPAPSAVVDGLRVALWIGGITSVADGLLAFLLKRKGD